MSKEDDEFAAMLEKLGGEINKIKTDFDAHANDTAERLKRIQEGKERAKSAKK